MKAVSRFEADLLRLLHALLGAAPISGVFALIGPRHARPACLSRDAVALVQDALAKGCVLRLAREGGWSRARHVRGERVVTGRLWDRTPPDALGLDFSAETLEFLLWLLCDEPGSRPARWGNDGTNLALGDRVFLFLAYEALRPSPFSMALRSLPVFASHGLCRLAFPEDFTAAPACGTTELTPWCDGTGAYVLEVLQLFLARRWTALEEHKRQSDVAHLRAVTRVQERVLDALLPALDAAGRRDLARFVLEAARGAFLHQERAENLIRPGLLRELRLAERTEVRRSAVFLLSALDRLRQWEQQARQIGYFDTGYAAAQLWKADWEAHSGETLCERGRALRREWDPLQAQHQEENRS
jgi:hypothetical protein